MNSFIFSPKKPSFSFYILHALVFVLLAFLFLTLRDRQSDSFSQMTLKPLYWSLAWQRDEASIALRQAQINVLGLEDVKLEILDFPTPKLVSWDAIEVLIDEDPRQSLLIKKIPLLFDNDLGNLLYVPKTVSFSVLKSLISSPFWSPYDSYQLNLVFYLLFFIIFLYVWSFLFPQQFLFTIFYAVLCYVLFGDTWLIHIWSLLALFLCLALFYPYWSSLWRPVIKMSPWQKKKNFSSPYQTLLILLILSPCLFILFNTNEKMLNLLILLGTMSLSFLTLNLWPRLASWPFPKEEQKTRFISLQSAQKLKRKYQRKENLLISLLAISAIIPLFFSWQIAQTAPQKVLWLPQYFIYPRSNFDSLLLLFQNESPLPHLADYVAHQYQQQSLLYSYRSKDAFPLEGNRFIQHNYEINQSQEVLELSPQTLLLLDEPWLKTELTKELLLLHVLSDTKKTPLLWKEQSWLSWVFPSSVLWSFTFYFVFLFLLLLPSKLYFDRIISREALEEDSSETL